MSKYTGLPDIDTAPDVFETADEPEDILRPSEDLLKPNEDEPALRLPQDGIDESALPPRSKAGRAVGRAQRRDPRIEYYASDSSSGPDGDHGRSSKAESTSARLRRLKAELAELERDLGPPSASAPGPAAGQRTDPTGPSEGAGPARAKGKRKSVLPPREAPDLWKELGGLKERLDGLEVGGLAGEGSAKRGGAWTRRLEALKVAQIPGQRSPLPSTSHGTESVDPPVGGEPAGIDGLGDIDKRLALLEGLIGPSDVSPETPSASIQSTVARLDYLLALLSQPRQLDAVSRRVKLLLVDLDRAAAASRRAGSSLPLLHGSAPPPPPGQPLTLAPQEHQALTALFPLLGRLDPMLPVLPGVLNRLRSLASLHSEAARVAEGLRRLQAEDKRGTEELKDLQEVVRGVQGGLGEAVTGIQNNWAVVDERMRGLEERLRKLQ